MAPQTANKRASWLADRQANKPILQTGRRKKASPEGERWWPVNTHWPLQRWPAFFQQQQQQHCPSIFTLWHLVIASALDSNCNKQKLLPREMICPQDDDSNATAMAVQLPRRFAHLLEFSLCHVFYCQSVWFFGEGTAIPSSNLSLPLLCAVAAAYNHSALQVWTWVAWPQ